MNNSIAIQYTIVGIIVLGAFTWLYILLYRDRKKGNGGCMGCSLNNVCDPKNKKKIKKGCATRSDN